MADQWCEKRMWNAIGVDTNAEIFSIISAISFFIIPFVKVPRDIPGSLVLIQCCMCHIGFGTIIFHALIPNNPVYVVMDYYPMILFGSALLYLYVSCEFRVKHATRLDRFFFESSYSLLFFFFLLTSWILLLLYMLDDEMVGIMQSYYPGGEYISYFNTINIVLVAPMLTVFCLYTFNRFAFHEYAKAWGLLVLAMIFYFVNYLGCPNSYWLGIFHGLYHIAMAFALWYIACMGITIDSNEWKLNWFILYKVEPPPAKVIIKIPITGPQQRSGV